MRTWIVAVCVSALCAALPATVDAKRLGGGRSQGMQRDMPARTSPDAATPKPATPQPAAGQQAAPAAPGAPGAAAPAAPKRSWLGPLAGLAAGLGLAALFHSLGIGEGLGSLLLMVALAAGGFLLLRMFLQRMAPQPAAARSMGASGSTPVSWPAARPVEPAPAAGPQALEPVSASTPQLVAAESLRKAFVPAAFDHESFERAAKLIFIRMQAANDASDLEDLRQFTTPEMFAAVRLDLQDRGGVAQATDVVEVQAQVLDVAEEAGRQVVSVRFHGRVREEAGAQPTPFNEVWHLVKPLDGSRDWAVAGIEQLN